MYLHTCMHIYIYIYIHIYIYINMYIYMYIYIYIYITQSALVPERYSVVTGSNPTQTNFLYLFLKIAQW